MISAKIHYIPSGNSQDINPEIINSTVEKDHVDHFALASKYYAEARKCMVRGDMQEANDHLNMAMDYATSASEKETK